MWKDAKKADEASSILGITANKLKELELIDSIIEEPQGGAHTNHEEIATKLKKTLKDNLKKLQQLSTEELLENRLKRIMKYGKFEETSS